MTAKEKYDLKFGGANASPKVDPIVTEIKDNGSDLKDNDLNELVDNAIKEVIREDEKQEIFKRLNEVEVKKTDCAIDEGTKQEFENMEKNMEKDLTIQYHNELIRELLSLKKEILCSRKAHQVSTEKEYDIDIQILQDTHHIKIRQSRYNFAILSIVLVAGIAIGTQHLSWMPYIDNLITLAKTANMFK